MKDLDQINIMAKAEMGFIKMIVYPLWSLVNTFLDNELEEILQILNKNAQEWEKIYIESTNDPEKKSFLNSLQQEDQISDNASSKEEANGLKRAKSLFSKLKNASLKKK